MNTAATTRRRHFGVKAVWLVLVATLVATLCPPIAREASAQVDPVEPDPDAAGEPDPDYANEVLADAPLVYYRFNELSGTTAFDSSGNAHDGLYGANETLLGAPGALVLGDDPAVTSGSDDEWAVTSSDAGLPTGDEARTMEVWARNTGGGNGKWLMRYGPDAGGQFGLYKHDGGRVRVYFDSSHRPFELPYKMTDGAWHHYAVTYDGDNLGFWFDGAMIGTHQIGAIDTQTPGDGLRIGEVAGDYDEAAVYDRVLTGTEISQRFALAETGEVCRDPLADGYGGEVAGDDPVAYLPLGELTEAVARTAFDRSTNCVNGAYSTHATGQGIDAQVTDPSDGAVTSDSDDEWVAIRSDDGLPTGDEARTMEVWARNSGSVNEKWLMRYGSDAGGRFGLYKHASNELRVVYGPDAADHFAVTLFQPHNDGVWRHYAVSWEPFETGAGGEPGGTLVLYVDGAAIGTTTLDVDIDTQTPGDGLRIGELGGDYDEAAVYPSALSPERISAHWTRGAAGVGVDDGVCPVAPVDGYGGLVASGQPSTYLRLGEFVDRGLPPVPDERVAFDVSTNGDGCMNGAVTTRSSSVPGALSFDTDQGLSSPNNWRAVTRSDGDLPAGDAARTMEVWARSESTWSGYFLMHYGSVWDGRFGLYKWDESTVRVYYGGGTQYFALPHSMEDGAWHHYAVTYDGDNLGMWADGAMVGTHQIGAIDTQTPGDGLWIGQQRGDYDEAAVYPRVLTAAEIQERFDSATKAGTTTTVTGPVGDWLKGVDLSFTVTAESTVSSETPAGTVELLDDDTLLGTATLDASGQATFTVQLPGGNHRIWARYGGDDEFMSSDSVVIERFVTVTEPTDTALGISASASTFGEVVDLTATVTTPAATPLVPSGEVVFVADGTEIATALLVDGVGSATVTAGDVGSWNIEARYSGDVNFEPSTSPVTPHTVDPAPTTLSIGGPVDGSSVFSEPVGFAAEVATIAPGAGVPAGTVTFFVDGAQVDEKVLVSGTATSSALTDLSVGAHQVTAVFNPVPANWVSSDNTASPLVHQVLPAPTSAFVEVSEAVVAIDDAVQVTATVTSDAPATATPTGEVRLLVYGVEQGVAVLDGSGVASFDLDTSSAGGYAVIVEYLGEDGFASSASSATAVLVANEATVTVTGGGGGSAVHGEPVTFTATVQPSHGGVTEIPGGSVTLRVDGAPVVTGTLDATGSVELTTAGLVVGDNTVTVSYGGDFGFVAATSDPVTETISVAGSSVELVSSNNPAGSGQNIVLTATVTAVAPGAGSPTGFVTITDDTAQILGTFAIDTGGTATGTISIDTEGSYELVASYGGDTNFDSATSTPLTQQVGAGSITGTVTDSTGGSVGGVQVSALVGDVVADSAVTATDGTYALDGLEDGEYEVYFNGASVGLASQWYDNAQRRSDATTVTVTAETSIAVDAQLEPAPTNATLTGTLTADDTGDPIAAGTVYVVGAADPTVAANLTGTHPNWQVPPLSGLSMTATVNDRRADTPAGPPFLVGDAVAPPVLVGDELVWEFEVTNTGSAELTDVTVAETSGLAITCPTDDHDATIATLHVGEVVTCTATETATGGLRNRTATATTADSGADTSITTRYFAVTCTIIGTEDDDILTGTDGSDVICGVGGNNIITGGKGNDILIGGPGNDVLIAGGGNNIIDGGGGHDELRGGEGDDVVHGGPGNDQLFGGGGHNILFGEEGNDHLEGGNNSDILYGGPGDDVLMGQGGRNVLNGGEGNDVLHGGDDDDVLYGGDGNDHLYGGLGHNVLYGGGGNDYLHVRGAGNHLDGGPGYDIFDDDGGENTVIDGGEFEALVTTAADGTWSLTVPEGRYHIAFTAEGYRGEAFDDTTTVPDIATLTVTDAATVTVDASLQATSPD